MKENNHSEDVINYSIDNKVSLAKAYAAIIEQKIAKVDKGLQDLRRDVEFTIEDVRCSK
jgi:phage shock protein A|tara:strand:+ start:1406 stop:1582 length:177 start_codon:yes stop_codon:yes gene_type:complete